MLADVDRRIEPDPRRVRIVHGGETIVDTRGALTVTESGPPAYYVPVADVSVPLERTTSTTTCPWKGAATYWSLPGGDAEVAWGYDDPLPDAEPLRDHVAFYASRVDECWVDDIRVTPQPGAYYGGWIVDDVTA
jgi:uncharacterized protein (DUF427 family)